MGKCTKRTHSTNSLFTVLLSNLKYYAISLIEKSTMIHLPTLKVPNKTQCPIKKLQSIVRSIKFVLFREDTCRRFNISCLTGRLSAKIVGRSHEVSENTGHETTATVVLEVSPSNAASSSSFPQTVNGENRQNITKLLCALYRYRAWRSHVISSGK